MISIRATTALLLAAEFLGVLSAVRVIGILVGHPAGVSVRAQAAIATTLLASGVAFYSARVAHLRWVQPRSIGAELAMGVLSLVALRLALGFHANASVVGPASLALIFIAAAGEEVVFRVSGPAIWKRRLRSLGLPARVSGLIALLGAQVLFALAHFVTARRLVMPQPYDVERLVVAGLAYSIVVGCVGWGVAAGVHAAVNIDLVDAGFHAAPPATLTLHLTGLLLVTLLAQQCSTSPSRDAVTGRLVEVF